MITLTESHCSICNKELITRGGGQLIMSPGCYNQLYRQTCMNPSLMSLNGFSCSRCNNINDNKSTTKVKFQVSNLFRCKMSWPVSFRFKRDNTRIPVVGETDHTAIAISDNRMPQHHNDNNNTSQQLFNLHFANEDCMICLQSLQPNNSSNNNTFAALNTSYCLPILCSAPHHSSQAAVIMSPGCCGKFYHQHCIQQMVKAKARLHPSSLSSLSSTSLLCPNCRHAFFIPRPQRQQRSIPQPPSTISNNYRDKWVWWLLFGGSSRRRSPHQLQASVAAAAYSTVITTTNNSSAINNNRNIFTPTATMNSTNNNPLSQILSAILNLLAACIQQQVAELNMAINRVIYFIVELSLLILFVLLFLFAVLLQKKSPILQQY